jgi:hypothetical protein
MNTAQTEPVSTESTARRKAEEILWQDIKDPVRFVERCLGHRTWPRQREMLQAIARHSRVAVKAAHSLSKSFSAAEALLWWLARYGDGVVLTTSPTARQVQAVIWTEVRKSLNSPLRRIRFPQPGIATLKCTESCFAMGFSTSSESAGVNMAGFKSRHMLIIVDEAIGVEGAIWEALDGALATGNVKVMTLCNPLVPGGYVYDSFTKNRAQWHCITIDAMDSPNLEGCTLDELRALPVGLNESGHDKDGYKITELFDFRPWPELASRHWVYEMLNKHGERSAWFQARVRGIFPEQSESSLYPLAWLERARGDVTPIVLDALLDQPEIVIGIDVAGPGKAETAAVARVGRNKISARAWETPDPRGEVLAWIRTLRGHIKVVNVDSTGIGFYFCKHLTDHNLPVEFVNFGAISDTRDRVREHGGKQYEIEFANIKAEIYWYTREALQHDLLFGLTDEEISQAVSIRFEYDSLGRVNIESKEKRARRGLPSPDKWEAIVLAYGMDPFVGRMRMGPSRHDPEWQDLPAVTVSSRFSRWRGGL